MLKHKQISWVLSATLLTVPSFTQAEEVNIGISGGVSGPIAAMAPPMVNAAELAIAQVNSQGGLLNGVKITPVIGDSGCNPQNAIDAVTKLVNLDNVIALVGPHCSGATIAAAESIAIPAGVALISPSATAPTVSTLDDNDLVFRTVPSDAYQGQSLARTLLKKGMRNVAVAYLNNDYGKGLAGAFRDEFEAKGGKIAAYEAHEGGKASYRSNLSNLASSEAPTLVIFDYANDSGLTILRESLENGFFTSFIGGDGMKSDLLISELGAENLTTFAASAPVGKDGRALEHFNDAFESAGGNKNDIFITTSYDAAFILALAAEHAGTTDRAAIARSIREVASAPGITILPGQWKKAKLALAAGQKINYEGASGSHEFDANGDVPGSYAFFVVRDGEMLPQETMQ